MKRVLVFFMLLSLSFPLWADIQKRGYKVDIFDDGRFSAEALIQIPRDMSLEDIFLEGFWNPKIVVDMDEDVVGMKFENGDPKSFENQTFKLNVTGKKFIKMTLPSNCRLQVNKDFSILQAHHSILQACDVDMNSTAANFLFADKGTTRLGCWEDVSGEKFCHMKSQGQAKAISIPFYSRSQAYMAISAAYKYIFNAFLMEHFLYGVADGDSNSDKTFVDTDVYQDYVQEGQTKAKWLRQCDSKWKHLKSGISETVYFNGYVR